MLLPLTKSHADWHPILEASLNTLDSHYVEWLIQHSHWLPGLEPLFAAFSLPLSKTRYILFGESPYPRNLSANGYAFWDAEVDSLWSMKGLSTRVNKATSLRNWIKMLLVAEGYLDKDISQEAIANLDKTSLVQTADALFTRLMQQGVLLLNASLVYSENEVVFHAKQWLPFMQSLVAQLAIKKPNIGLILMGNIAKKIPSCALPVSLSSEHPYNVSFITNPEVIQFFAPLQLLRPS